MIKTVTRRLLAVILIALMLCLAACSDKPEETEKQTEPPQTESAIPDETDKETESVSETETVLQTETEETADDEDYKVFGKLTRTTYVNTEAGITLGLPSGWTYANENQLATLMNLNKADVEELGYQGAALKQETITDVYAVKDDNSAHIAIMFDRAGAALLPADYCSRMKQQIVESYKENGVKEEDITAGEIETVTLGSKEYSSFRTTLKREVFNVVQTYYCRSLNEEFMTVIVTTVSGGSTDDLSDYFK